MRHELRPYQQEAAAAVAESWSTARSALVVMATGTGKSAVFATIAEAWVQKYGTRVLILAHRAELLAQAQAHIAAWTSLTTALEQGESRDDRTAPVVVASVPTLVNRLTQFDHDGFGLVIVDEAHHAPAESYRRILEFFETAKVLGVTATPDRLDKQGLGGQFETVAFVYELRDAIEDGFLVPIRQLRVTADGIDLSTVRTVAGDFVEADLERVMMVEKALHEVAEPTVRLAGGRPTIVFATTVAHAQALAEVMRRYAGADQVAEVNGGTPKLVREQVRLRFLSGQCQFLVNVLLYTEGLDLPPAACIAMARPTKSRALYSQMIGRGTRLFCAFGCAVYCKHELRKVDLLALDFVGNSGRHKLVTVLDLIGGADDEAVQERAHRVMETSTTTAIDAVLEAERQLAEEARIQFTAKARTYVEDIDPFVVLGIRPTRGRWGGREPTDAQLDVLRRNGVPAGDMDRGQVSAVIDAIMARRQRGLCTLKQAAVLARHGYETDLPYDEARAVLTALEANGWRRVGV